MGICSEEKSTDGVVVVRVLRSRDAPHRLKANREFYIRRGQESEPMTVQEVRDVTLRRTSEFEELQARLDARREKMQQLLETTSENDRLRVALRLTLAPIQGRPFIHRVYRQWRLFPELRSFTATVGERKVKLVVPQSVSELSLMAVRPMLRGGRRAFHTEDNRFFVEQEVHSDGLAEIFFHFEPREPVNIAPLYSGWVMGLLANAFVIAESVRQVAEIPNAELVLDMEIGSSLLLPLTLGGFQELRYAGVGDPEIGTLQTNPLHLPRYTILGTDEFAPVAATVLNDLREAAGLPAMDDFAISLE